MLQMFKGEPCVEIKPQCLLWSWAGQCPVDTRHIQRFGDKRDSTFRNIPYDNSHLSKPIKSLSVKLVNNSCFKDRWQLFRDRYDRG